MHTKNTCSSTYIHIDYWRMTDTFMQFIFLSIAYRPINHPLLSQHIHLYNCKTKDTDAAFGSSGSFFHWPLISGSYECNPPFEVHRWKKTRVVELEAMIRHDMKKHIRSVVEIMFIKFHNHPSEYILFTITIQAPLKCPHCPPLH